MAKVLALVERREGAATLLRATRAVARVTGAEVAAAATREALAATRAAMADGPGELTPLGSGEGAVEAIVRGAATDDVRLLTLLLPERASAVSALLRLLAQCRVPVLVVPERAAGQVGEDVCRVLVPLDGTVEAAAAVAETLDLFAASGADIVVLHVFDAATVPRFWDQPAHARPSWEAEFLARHCPQPTVRLTLRSGVAGDQVLDVAGLERVDLIALGWSQNAAAGRARTVRATLAAARTPILLVPAQLVAGRAA